MTLRPADRAHDAGFVMGGFTLIELIVVLVIMGLMLTLVVSRGPLFSRSLTLRETAGELADGLRETRSYAIGNDRSAMFDVNLRAGTFQIPGQPPHRLPPIFAVSVSSVAGEVRPDGMAGIRFDPDGSSTGGHITIKDNRREVEVGVDWLTGRVHVVDAP